MGYSLNVVATEYRLIDNYTTKLDRIASGTQSLGNKVESLLQATLRFATGGLLVAGGAVLAFGASAIKAYADFENLTITMESLTGSAEKAASKIAFIRKLALPATNTFSELAEAGVQLESYGIRAEAVLPSLAKLASAMKMNPQALQEGVRIFGEAAAGRILLARQLAAVGLSKGQLEKQGLKFDEHGRLLGSAKETMDALKAVIDSKYGNILEKMANTTSSKLDNLRNSWELMLIKVGQALSKYALPAMDRLTHMIDVLEKSEGFDRFLSRLGKNFIKFVLVIAEAFSFLQLTLGFIRLAMRDFAGAFLSFAAAAAITIGAGYFARGAVKLMKELKVGGGGPLGNIDVPKDPNPELGNFEPGQEPVEKENTQKAIERNTRQTAESMSSFAGDLRRYVVGGGPLAGIGITPTELAGIRGAGGGGGRNITVHAPGAHQKILEALEDVAQKTHFEIMRQKPWGHTEFVR